MKVNVMKVRLPWFKNSGDMRVGMSELRCGKLLVKVVELY